MLRSGEVSDGAREVPLFRIDGSQAVRIPVGFELPGDRAIMRRDGDRLILEPMRRAGLLELLAGWEPLDEAPPKSGETPSGPESPTG